MANTSLYQILQEAGFTGSGLQMAYAIAMAESGGNAGATNTEGNSHGEDRGLFQINSYYHSEVSDAQAFDPLANAKAAYRISKGGTDWSQWATYNNGAYKNYLSSDYSAQLGQSYGKTGAVVGGSSMLKVGSRGSEVKQLQQALGITADGIYGPQTEAAVKSYQTKHHLTVDGIAGPQTLGSLGLTGSGSGGGSAMSDVDLASQFGYNAAFFNTDPSLKALVDRAVNEGWSQDRFDAELKKSSWYQKHDAAQRQWIINSTDDPAEAKRQEHIREKQIKEQAAALGVTMTTAQINQFALQSLQNGLSDSEIQEGLASHLAYVKGVQFSGQAGVTEEQFNSMAHDMGLSLSQKAIETWVRRTLAGWNSQEDYETYLRDLAKSAFPGISAQLDRGMTVKQVADPYVQQMSSTLELNPDSIDFSKDPLIRNAFAYTAPTTGKKQLAGSPGLMPLWQFDQQVKQDPRWLKTENAHNSLMDVTTNVLKDWGVTF